MIRENQFALKIKLTRLAGGDAGGGPCPRIPFEFHISKKARQKYGVDAGLFSLTGNVILPDFHTVRLLAQKINEKRDIAHHPELAIKAGQLNALGLVDEILHYVVQLYRRQKNPDVMKEALQTLRKQIGAEALEKTLLTFVRQFPPLAVHRGRMTAEEYLNTTTEGMPNAALALEELLMLWLANKNPATKPFVELFDDSSLRRNTPYLKIMNRLHRFFDTQPPFGPENQNLVDMLRTPAIVHPHSLSAQLEYIKTHWGLLLSKFLYRLLTSLDFIKEEEKAVFAGGGPGPTRVIRFGEAPEEPERFSPDMDWMPRLVLIAKSTYVWLDQLSKKYQRSITRLDQIPDEELDQLARWGFTGLWLIGLWERSKASRRIKQLCGNPEAVASAYSVFDYQIAEDLGGEAAYQNLRQRAWQRGIRMGGDMVPNHMGIDSRWVIEHPDRFIQLDHSPYPGYTFNGPNLSWHPNVGIYLEDHYYDRSDAAVVFKRVDFSSGETRYIYHGNDGTSMPWNDTAQLNYLLEEVREAVIQTILQMARKFPIIRFDAAMTLTKKHFQRLWFPEPGSGGDIPTRAEFGLTKEEFDRLMPNEFWREVVDRVAQEAPDTLLLAEAFWLMESYFVRTLGMHRVYNSAFMNMLKNEENDKYRESVKNVLEFNPEILKRFVNFMNNPDEETAVVQFGKGDKYFGVCTMLVTMPGLPMFGHGQVEGFAEKYGMEYKKAYWDEKPDPELVARHEREIFPLMHKRYLFADVQNFLLYDFFAPDGHVNENVFAYSNQFHDEKALVIYNNKFENAAGWIRTSVAYRQNVPGADSPRLIQKSLGEGLGLHNESDNYLIFQDHTSGLEFIRSSQEIWQNGLYVELGAYKTHVFLNIREIRDDQWQHYRKLHEFLNGRGVPSIEDALKEMLLQPIQTPFRELVHPAFVQKILSAMRSSPEETAGGEVVAEFEQKALWFFGAVRNFTGGSGDEKELTQIVRRELELFLRIPVLDKKLRCRRAKNALKAAAELKSALLENPAQLAAVPAYILLHRVGQIISSADFAAYSRNSFDEWLLGKPLENCFSGLGISGEKTFQLIQWIKIIIKYQAWWKLSNTPHGIFNALFADQEVQAWLKVNRYKEVLWFNREAFDQLLTGFLLTGILDSASQSGKKETAICRDISARYKLIQTFRKVEQQSGYQVEKLLSGLKKKK